MEVQLKVGDKVSFLNSTGEGVILKIEDDFYLVEDEHGFNNSHLRSELVPKMNVSETKLFSAKNAFKKKDESLKKEKLFHKSKKEWKIDLHMENLVDSHRGMTNHEILTLQLNRFKSFLRESREAKIGRIEVVHGQGTGKLKSEITLLINDIRGAEIFDATFAQGASIIEQKFNLR